MKCNVIAVPGCGYHQVDRPNVPYIPLTDIIKSHANSSTQHIYIDGTEIPPELWTACYVENGEIVWLTSGISGSGPPIERGSERHLGYIIYNAPRRRIRNLVKKIKAL